MKKGFIMGLVVSVALLLCVNVFAETQNIEAFFNNIKMTINGKEIANMDVQPFIYQGRTFVPIKFVADNLGMQAKWNESTNTVELVGNAQNISVERIKLYSKIADVYKYLKEETNMLDIHNNLVIAHNNILITKNKSYLISINDGMKVEINAFLDASDKAKAITRECEENKIVLSDMKVIIDKYSKAIDSYQKCLSSLLDYANTGNEKYMDDYTTHINNGYSLCIDCYSMSETGYKKYYNMIQSN